MKQKVIRLQWNPDDLEAAMRAVQEGTTVSAAAKKFQVPRKTLDDRVKGRVQHGKNAGPATALTVEEKSALQYNICSTWLQ